MLQRYKIFLNGCNITTFFNTIQSLFYRNTTKNTLNTTFYLNVTESQTPLEDVNMNCHQKKKRSIGSITRLSVVYSHIIYL